LHTHTHTHAQGYKDTKMVKACEKRNEDARMYPLESADAQPRLVKS